MFKDNIKKGEETYSGMNFYSYKYITEGEVILVITNSQGPRIFHTCGGTRCLIPILHGWPISICQERVSEFDFLIEWWELEESDAEILDRIFKKLNLSFSNQI